MEGFPFSLLPIIVLVGTGMFLYGVGGLVVLFFRWICRKRNETFLVIVALLLIPQTASASSAEVRRHCATRTMYQMNANHSSRWFGSRIWTMELCAHFEHFGDRANAMPPATLTWTAYLPYTMMWHSDGCEAWIYPQSSDGTFQVLGRCEVRMAWLPFLGVIRGDFMRRTVWVGYKLGPDGFLDYQYPERVDFANEIDSSPVPIPDYEPEP